MFEALIVGLLLLVIIRLILEVHNLNNKYIDLLKCFDDLSKINQDLHTKLKHTTWNKDTDQ